MSRWNEKKDEFLNYWRSLEQLCNDYEISNDLDQNKKSEVLRLKKIVSFISNHIETFFAELTHRNFWDDAINHTNQVIQEINNNNFEQANDLLDNLYTKISPYITANAKSMRGFTQALNKQSKEIENAIKSTNNISQETIIKINQIEIEATNNSAKIKQYSAELFGDETQDTEQLTLAKRISSLYETFKDKAAAIKDFHKKLTVSQPDQKSLIDQITSSKEDIDDKKEKSTEGLAVIENRLKELGHYYQLVFGNVAQDKKGLKEEIGQRIYDLNQFDNDQKEIFKELQKQIDDLLEGATSAGLASAYDDLKIEIGKKTKTLKQLPNNFKCADLICDFCGHTSQVKTFRSDEEGLPNSILGAAWQPQKRSHGCWDIPRAVDCSHG